jgi:hypothetical protein
MDPKELAKLYAAQMAKDAADHAGAKAGFSISKAPFTRCADFKNSTAMIVVRPLPGENLPGSRYEADN